MEQLSRLTFVLAAKEGELVKGLKQAGKSIAGLRDVAKKTEQSVGKSFRDLDAKISGFGKKLKSSITGVRTALLALGTGAAVRAPIKFAQDFEKALVNVDTLLVDSAVSIEKYNDQLLELSQTSSKDLIDLTEALYDTISAGIPTVEGAAGAFAVLNSAQKAAVAGLATTKEAVGATASIINAYGANTINAAQATDKLLTAVRLGRTTFPKLASNIGKVAGSASTFGVKLDDLLASSTALSLVIPSTEQVMVSINSVMKSIAAPSEKAAAAFERYGIEVGATALANRGLIGSLEVVRAAIGDNKDALTELFEDTRAFRGASVLLGEQFKNLSGLQKQFANSTGAVDLAVAKVEKTFGNTAAILRSQFTAVLTQAGLKVLPKLKVVFEDLGKTLVKNQDTVTEFFGAFIDGLLSVGKFVVDFGPAILTFFASFFVASKIASATTALAKFGKELKGIGAIAAAAGADAGGKFASSFTKGVSIIKNVLIGLIRNPTLAGIVIATAVTLGAAFASAFGAGGRERQAKQLEKLQKSAREVEEREKRALELRRRGLTEQEATKIKGGALFEVGGPLGEELGKTAVSIEELLDKVGEIGAARVVRARLNIEVEATARANAARDTAKIESDAINQVLALRIKAGGEATEIETERQKAADQAFNLASAAADKQSALVKRLETTVTDAVLKARAEAEESETLAIAGIEARLTKEDDAAAQALKKAQALARERANLQAEAARARQELLDSAADVEESAAESIRDARQAARDATNEEIAARFAGAGQAAAEELAFLRQKGTLQSEFADAEIDAALVRLELIAEERESIIAGSAERRTSQLEATKGAIEGIKAEAEAALAVFKEGSEERKALEKAVQDAVTAFDAEGAANRRKIDAETNQEIIANARATEAELEKIRKGQAEKAKAEVKEAETPEGPRRGIVGQSLIRIAELAGDAFLDGLKAGADFLLASVGEIASVVDSELVQPIAGALEAPLALISGGIGDAFSELTGGGGISGAEGALSSALENATSLSGDLIESLPAFVETLLTSLTESLPAIIANLAQALAGTLVAFSKNIGPLVTTVIESLAAQAPVIIDALVEAIPLLVGALFDVITTIVDVLPGLIEQILMGVVDMLPGLFETIGEKLGPLIAALAAAIPRIITILLQQAPRILAAAVAGIGKVVEGLILSIPEIVAALIEEIPNMISALILEFPRLITALVNGVANAATGGIFDFGGGDDGGGGGGNTLKGAAAGAGIGTIIAPGVGTAIGAGIGALVGLGEDLGWFHQGGFVKGPGSPVMASLMAAAGAPAFRDGGLVGGVERSLRNAMNAGTGDDVPSLLKQGEAVVSRLGVGTMGEDNVRRANRGQDVIGPGLRANVSIQGSGPLESLIEDVVVDLVRDDGSQLRAQLDRDSGVANAVPIRGRR